jgi:hypothetical protein
MAKFSCPILSLTSTVFHGKNSRGKGRSLARGRPRHTSHKLGIISKIVSYILYCSFIHLVIVLVHLCLTAMHRVFVVRQQVGMLACLHNVVEEGTRFVGTRFTASSFIHQHSCAPRGGTCFTCFTITKVPAL